MTTFILEIVKDLFIVAVALLAASTFSVVTCSQSDICTENTARLYYDGSYANGIAGMQFIAGLVIAIDNSATATNK
tara:strand:+ start:66 stop:293 length:228 start_codon:yes stop_codon:yes gene_type:complete